MSGRVGVGIMVSACNRLGARETSGRLRLRSEPGRDVVMTSLQSTSLSARRVRVPAILATAFVMLAAMFFAVANINLLRESWDKPEVLTATHGLPQSDFGLFWCAGNELIAQASERFGDSSPDGYKSICQVNILARNTPIFLAWPYPPTMGLLLASFSVFSIKWAFWIWRAFCVGVALAVLRAARLRWGAIIIGLLSPASWHDLIGGQNGTLTGAMLFAVLSMAARRPVLAGILSGLLTLKPHLGAPILVAVLRLRAWTMGLVAAGVALCLAAVSLLIWGLGGWAYFIGVAQHDEWLTAAMPFKERFPAAGITIYDMARSLGAPNASALVFQAVVAILALGAMWRLWRPGAISETPRAIITVSLSILVLPHAFLYDLVGFGIGMAVLMVALSGWAAFAAALFWLWSGYTLTFVNQTGLLLFPLCAAAGAALAWRFRHEPALQ